MYWQLSIRKSVPVSAGVVNTASLTGPVAPPERAVTAIEAWGSEHVGAPPDASANFTGTTPRPALKLLDPSALIGCCTVAVYELVTTTSAYVSWYTTRYASPDGRPEPTTVANAPERVW